MSTMFFLLIVCLQLRVAHERDKRGGKGVRFYPEVTIMGHAHDGLAYKCKATLLCIDV